MYDATVIFFFIKNFKRKHFEKIVELMYNNTQVGKVKYTEMRSYMFEVNEKVVYGVVGVCEIEQIGRPPIKGIDKDYYFLQPVYDTKGIIYSPVENNKVMIRSIIGKDTCIKLIDRAKNCKKDEALNEKIHPSRSDEMVKSQDVIQLMHLVRALFNIKNDRAKELRRMKSADNRMLATARKLLYGEIAAAMNEDYTAMSEQMDNYLSVL